MKKYTFFLLCTCFGWAGNFIVSKHLVQFADALTITSLRWIIATVCLLPVVLIVDKTLRIPKKAILPIFFMALTGVVLNNIFQFIALAHTTATNAGLLSALNMLAVAGFAMLFFGERLTRTQAIAAAISFFGVMIVLTGGHPLTILHMQFNPGDLWMLAAVLMWGIYTAASRWAMQYTSPLTAIFYSGVFGLAVLLPINIPTFHVEHITWSFVAGISYTAIISTVLCMLLWNICVQKIGSLTSSLFLNFNPIFSALLAIIFLHERISVAQVIGTAVVIAGCCLFLLKDKIRFSPRKIKIKHGH
ncbi:MAG: DMT family transporter [Solibacillus sp.]